MRSASASARLVARRRVRRARGHVRPRLDADPRRWSLARVVAVALRVLRRLPALARRRRRSRAARGRSSGGRSSACFSGSRRRRCRATGCSISPARGSCSSSTTSRSTASPSSPTAACIPGYAFPLWHGFLALIAKVAGEDPERVVTHLPSILAPLAVLVAFEAGWALFRRTWAAGVTAGAQVAMIAFAPGMGGAYVFLSLPATSSRQLLVPAALALALESVRSPSLGLVASTAAAGFVLAVVHPTYAIFLWIPFVGFLVVRALWERADLRAGALALGALVVPAALFMLWLRPIVNDTRSVSPDADELQRAFEQYGSQLVVHSDTSYNLAPEVFTRAGAVAIARAAPDPARRLRGAAAVGGVRGRRLARGVRGDARARPSSRRSPTSSRSRRRAARPGSSRSRSPSPAGWACSRAWSGRSCSRSRSAPGCSCRSSTRATSTTSSAIRRRRGSRGSRSWAPSRRSSSGSCGGGPRSRPAPRSPRPRSSSRCSAAGSSTGTGPTRPRSRRSRRASSRPCATRSRAGTIVYSDPETSFRLAAFAPVYIAVAPPGHVADTEENRPYERARDARRFFRTGDLAIPRGYGAEYVVVDGAALGARARPPGRLRGRALHGLPPLGRPSPAAAARGLDAEEVAGLRGRGSRSREAPRRSGSSGRVGRPRRRARRAAPRRGAA